MKLQVNMLSTAKPANLSQVTTPYSSFAPLYDALLGRSMFPLVKRNFEWLVRRYRIRFRSAADVACGTGTFLHYLRRWGVPVFGVDRSKEMLRIARKKNNRHGVRLLKQDMRNFQLPRPVDLITCHFDSLNYLLSTFDLACAFLRFRANLALGGHAIFDMITDSWQETEPRVRVQFFRMHGVYSVWIISRNPEHKIRIVTMHNFLITSDGKYRHEREVHAQRQYPVGVVVELLGRCGFKLRGVRDALSLCPVSASSDRAIYVVSRNQETLDRANRSWS